MSDPREASGGNVAPGPPPLELVGVSKTFPGHRRPVVEGVHFVLGEGQLGFIGGKNGAGKTTLLRLAAGLLAPDDGAIRIAGADIEQHRRECQRRLGLLSAGNTGLYARLTVAQHLRMWAQLAFVPRPLRAQRIEAALETFQLTAMTKRRVDRLSMGERQRVRLSMAFLHRPSLVLLDEPATSLDESGVAALITAVESHRREGGAAVWCAPGRAPSGLEPDSRHMVVDGRLRSS